MKNIALMVCLALCLAGCGSAKLVSAANNVVMQGGQWEYVIQPDNGAITMYLDANVPGANLQFSGTNAVIFQPSQLGVAVSTAPLYCGDFNIGGSINISIMSGKLSWGDPLAHFANFSGDLAANGQSIANGTYSGGACSLSSGPGVGGPQVKGTFKGYTIAPVNGTYTGTLNSTAHGADVVTFVITQNPDFSLNMSGTSVENGVSTTIVPSTQPLTNIVLGATVYLGGSAKTVNGSDTFSFAGHLNPAATQLTVAIMNFGPNETVSGTLTKQ
jgi:hypothetical protein